MIEPFFVALLVMVVCGHSIWIMLALLDRDDSPRTVSRFSSSPERRTRSIPRPKALKPAAHSGAYSSALNSTKPIDT